MLGIWGDGLVVTRISDRVVDNLGMLALSDLTLILGNHMRQFTLILLSLTLWLPDSIAIAADYEHGHHALQIFDADGFRNAPRWVQMWVGFMMLTFLSGLFFVRNQTVARWVVGGMFAGLVVSMLAGSVLGIPALSGFIALIHILFWSPGLYQLLTKRPFAGPASAFTIWSGVMTLVILFSFVFDVRDAFIYLRHLI